MSSIAGDLVPRRVVDVLPRAADARVAEVEHRVVDDEDAALRGDIVDDPRDGAAVVPEAVVDVVVDADGIAVAAVHGDLGATEDQEVAVRLLVRGDQRVLGDRVVVAHVDEVEAAARRELIDLIERRDASPLCTEWT